MFDETVGGQRRKTAHKVPDPQARVKRMAARGLTSVRIGEIVCACLKKAKHPRRRPFPAPAWAGSLTFDAKRLAPGGRGGLPPGALAHWRNDLPCLLEHLHVHQPQVLVVEKVLGFEAEGVQVGVEVPAVGPGAGARDADPAPLITLHVRRHVHQPLPLVVEELLRLGGENWPTSGLIHQRLAQSPEREMPSHLRVPPSSQVMTWMSRRP